MLYLSSYHDQVLFVPVRVCVEWWRAGGRRERVCVCVCVWGGVCVRGGSVFIVAVFTSASGERCSSDGNTTAAATHTLAGRGLVRCKACAAAERAVSQRRKLPAPHHDSVRHQGGLSTAADGVPRVVSRVVVCGALQQLCLLPVLSSFVGDLLAILLKGCSDTVANVRLVAAQFVADAVESGGVPSDRIASEIKCVTAVMSLACMQQSPRRVVCSAVLRCAPLCCVCDPSDRASPDFWATQTQTSSTLRRLDLAVSAVLRSKEKMRTTRVGSWPEYAQAQSQFPNSATWRRPQCRSGRECGETQQQQQQQAEQETAKPHNAATTSAIQGNRRFRRRATSDPHHSSSTCRRSSLQTPPPDDGGRRRRKATTMMARTSDGRQRAHECHGKASDDEASRLHCTGPTSTRFHTHNRTNHDHHPSTP
jgi:hypothetical protein